ncbi:MAG: amino acid racemase [Oscillospiraceae bacterium]
MKKMLGVLGGLGSEASAVFYKKIVDNTLALNDQDHLNILIYNHADIPDRTEYITSGRDIELFEILNQDLKKLSDFGCEVLCIACNTSHYFIKDLQKNSKSEIVDMIFEAVKAVKEKSPNVKKIGIMGTTGTVKYEIYKNACEHFNIEPIYPDDEFQQTTMDIIYKQIKSGKKGSLEDFMKVSYNLKEKGAEKIILSCTELSVFAQENNLSDYYTDALDVLTKKVIILCGGKLV